MKVLCLVTELPTVQNRGVGVFAKEQINSLRQAGIEITTLLVKDRKNIKYISYFKAITRLHKEIRQNKYQLIHAHYGLNGLVAYTQSSLPVVVTFWGDDVLGTPSKKERYTVTSKMLVGFNKLVVHRAAAVIVQSDEMKRRLGRSDALIVPFGVDFNLFQLMDRNEACKKLEWEPDRRRILFANNPAIPVKQFALAEKIVKLIQNKIPDVELVITKNEPRKKIPLYINACDVLLLTSLHEGSPSVVKEAMACNLPIVSVDVGDVKEIISNSRNCFITTRSDRVMAERVVQVLEAGERSNGREHIQHLELQTIARRIIGIYQRV